MTTAGLLSVHNIILLRNIHHHDLYLFLSRTRVFAIGRARECMRASIQPRVFLNDRALLRAERVRVLYKTAVGDNRSHVSRNARSIPSSTTEFILGVKRETDRGRAFNPRLKSVARNAQELLLSKDFIVSPHLSYCAYFSKLYLVFLVVYTNVLCNMENACNFYTHLYCQE